MKTQKLALFLFIIIGLLTSCSNDDDSINQNETISGIWDLKNVSGGISGVDIDYEKGIVSWEFNAETNNLKVVSSIINTGPQSTYLPLQTGSYKYTLTQSNGKTFIKIEGFETFENGEYGRFVINTNGELIIDQGEGSEETADDFFILLFD